ncbi:MAG: O-acetyl-ADP-ribose deacetylase [Patescibacteria group bacterium]|jgi:O-acetyl-ADP-ribose deacetylase (regulator of RNase III)|nr:O-acetyl-ADP-ribose deacetylase [Patescibacteria group bacterium]
MKIKIHKGDITKLEVDAIVNSANQRMLGGGGLDGIIHREAGPELLEECKVVGECFPGEAKITKGYNLPAKHIIHTVGPIYDTEDGKEAEMLVSCYVSSLMLAKEHGVKTIAFPNISTGVYGYPIEEAVPIAIATVREFLDEEDHEIEEVIFVSFKDEDYDVYRKLQKY